MAFNIANSPAFADYRVSVNFLNLFITIDIEKYFLTFTVCLQVKAL